MIQDVSDITNQLLALTLSLYHTDLEFLRTASIDELEEEFKTEEIKDLIAFANSSKISSEIGPVAASNLKIAARKILRDRGHDEDWIQSAIPLE